ncbi:MAG: Kae1-associated kinase Bud32, partial [Desulfurococcales archaeon]|nr:Kae1-associated kinase Bud32 [Desulfurococcales archaeon]
MVSLDVGSVESKLRQLKLIGVGAEAEVRLGSYAGIKAVFKYRPPKRYRHKLLDFNLRFARTRREARLLLKASENHIPVPDLLAVYPTLALLVMEYVEGELLRVKLRREPLERGDLLVDAGRILASLHSIGIVHGDSTTSNYIVTPDGRLYIIDFGLSSASQSLEERAVDVHLFK